MTLRETTPPVYELGVARAAFSGTDGLSMSVQPKVLQWMEAMEPELVLGEGDRLTNGSFFLGVLELGYELRLAHLRVPPEVASARRLARAQELGRPAQNDTWVRGRKTKVEGVVNEFAGHVISLDATSDPPCMLSRLFDDPVVQALKGDGAVAN